MSYYNKNFYLEIFRYLLVNELIQIKLQLVYIEYNALKSAVFFNLIFIPCFSGFEFFKVSLQGLGPGFRMGPGFSGPGSRFRVQIQVLEVDVKFNFFRGVFSNLEPVRLLRCRFNKKQKLTCSTGSEIDKRFHAVIVWSLTKKLVRFYQEFAVSWR